MYSAVKAKLTDDFATKPRIGESAMLTVDLDAETGIAIVRPSGVLTQQDFVAAGLEIDPYIEEHKKLKGLAICAESFPGWDDFGSAISHLRFIHDHHRHIERVAAVSDSNFLKIMPSVVDHFVKAEVRHFDANQFDAAIAWIKSP
jgi:hypothetical protein